MGTSKSYIPKVTKNTTQTKLNITKTIKTGELNNPKGLAKIISSFKNSLIDDPSGLKKGNYVGAVSTIGGVIAAISSSSIGDYIDFRFNKDEKTSIQSPQDLFNTVIRNEEYLTEFEKSNVLEAVSQTLIDMHISNLEDLNSIDCDLFFKTFIVNLIYSLFLSSYYENINDKTKNPKETQYYCREIRQYIEGKILSEKSLTVKLISNQSKMYEYVKSVIDEILLLL